MSLDMPWSVLPRWRGRTATVHYCIKPACGRPVTKPGRRCKYCAARDTAEKKRQARQG